MSLFVLHWKTRHCLGIWAYVVNLPSELLRIRYWAACLTKAGRVGTRRAREGHEWTGRWVTRSLMIAEVSDWGREKVPELEASQGKARRLGSPFRCYHSLALQTSGKCSPSVRLRIQRSIKITHAAEPFKCLQKMGQINFKHTSLK